MHTEFALSHCNQKKHTARAALKHFLVEILSNADYSDTQTWVYKNKILAAQAELCGEIAMDWKWSTRSKKMHHVRLLFNPF